MNKIVIVGANEFQNRLVLKAHDLGYETHVVAWEDGAVAKETADYFYPVSITEKEEILALCRMIHPNAVASIASDLASVTVNYLAQHLGMATYHDEACVRRCTNKYEMREALSAAGIPTPWHQKVSGIEDVRQQELHFPLIVKPTDRSGSRAITKVECKEALAAAVAEAVQASFEHRALIEGYLCGEEYSCESISFEGEHHLLAFTKKYTTGAPNYIETGHVQPSGLPATVLEKARVLIPRALTALGIRYGAGHTEFRVDKEENIWLIEIGARMGGDFIGSDLVPLSTGYDFLKMVIDVAAGTPPDLTFTAINRAAGVRFIFDQSDADEINRLKLSHPDDCISAYISENIGMQAVKDSASRYGYAIFTQQSNLELMKWMKPSHEI